MSMALAGAAILAAPRLFWPEQTVKGPAIKVSALALRVEAAAAPIVARELQVNADIVPLEQRKRLTLPGDVLFDFGEAKLTEAGFRRVLKVAQVLRARGARKIVIEGHTDSRGMPSFNLDLSRQRARAVQAGLRAVLGEGDPIMEIRALGETDQKRTEPRDGVDDPVARRINRRVEIEIIEERA